MFEVISFSYRNEFMNDINQLFLLVLLAIVSKHELHDRVNGQSMHHCHNAYQCALTTVEDTSSPSRKIECYGYHSCSQAIKIESTANASIECYGGYACAGATLIQHIGTSYSKHIRCYGSFSCAFVDTIYNQYGRVYCSGELSCTKSTIIVENDKIYCSGSRGCYQSDLRSASHFFMVGHLGAQDAIIRCGNYNNNSNVVLDMDGYDAGNGAKLICNGVCNVNCYAGGCNNFTFGCEKNNTNCSINIDCIDAEYSDACPNGYIIPQYLSIPNLREKDFSTYNNSDESCHNTYALNCDDYRECYNISSFDRNGTICCTSYEACKSSINITINMNAYVNDSNYSYNRYDIAFRADGFFSAGQMPGTVLAQNGGDVYFAAHCASCNDNYNSIYRTRIKTITNSDIICSGSFATHYKVLSQASNLYCLGRGSCANTEISLIDGIIFGGGYRSLSFASVMNVVGSVYCVTRYSCLATTLINISANIVGLGSFSLYASVFNNVNGTVAGYGNQSLSLTQIINVASVCYNFVFMCGIIKHNWLFRDLF